MIVFNTNASRYTTVTNAKNVSYKTIYPGLPDKRRHPKILIYTTFFGSMNWYESSKEYFPSGACPYKCDLTDDKTDMSSADAVVFHLADITLPGSLNSGSGVWFSFPKYRRPDQVWVIHNLEPWPMLWLDTEAWQDVFNWTWSYPRSSDVVAPYGGMRSLANKEKKSFNHSILTFNYFGARKEDGGIAMISDCTDDARRYRVISTLRKYISIRVFGHCGEACPEGYESCQHLLHDFKFYLALENSDCYDYVSEKYWRALERKQIPIVAWKLNMSEIVIPKSYINVYDFPSVDEAGRYIQKVQSDKELYNSYFSWQLEYKLHYNVGYCELCKKLTDGKTQRMVYRDFGGWIKNNTCKPATVSTLL